MLTGLFSLESLLLTLASGLLGIGGCPVLGA